MRCLALKAKAKADNKESARDSKWIHTLNSIPICSEASTTRAWKRK
jgi:hypothetical protein